MWGVDRKYMTDTPLGAQSLYRIDDGMHEFVGV